MLRQSLLVLLLMTVSTFCAAESAVQLNFMSLNYQETLRGRVFDKVTGVIPGIELTSERTFNGWFINPAISLYKNHLRYEGALLGGTPLISNSAQLIVDFNARLGYRIFIKNDLDIIPFIQGSYYWWSREVPPIGNVYLGGVLTNIGMNGYNERYHYSAMAIGSRMDYHYNAQSQLKLMVSIGSTLTPYLNADVPLGLGFITTATLDARLQRRLTYRVKAEFMHAISNSTNWFVNFDFKHFAFGKSTVNALGIFEPDSRTNQYIFGVGIAF